MQKVEGSSPFIRFQSLPAMGRLSGRAPASLGGLGGWFSVRMQIRCRTSAARAAPERAAEGLVGVLDRASHDAFERVEVLIGDLDVLLVDLRGQLVVLVP